MSRIDFRKKRLERSFAKADESSVSLADLPLSEGPLGKQKKPSDVGPLGPFRPLLSGYAPERNRRSWFLEIVKTEE